MIVTVAFAIGIIYGDCFVLLIPSAMMILSPLVTSGLTIRTLVKACWDAKLAFSLWVSHLTVSL